MVQSIVSKVQAIRKDDYLVLPHSKKIVGFSSAWTNKANKTIKNKLGPFNILPYREF